MKQNNHKDFLKLFLGSFISTGKLSFRVSETHKAQENNHNKLLKVHHNVKDMQGWEKKFQ